MTKICRAIDATTSSATTSDSYLYELPPLNYGGYLSPFALHASASWEESRQLHRSNLSGNISIVHSTTLFSDATLLSSLPVHQENNTDLSIDTGNRSVSVQAEHIVVGTAHLDSIIWNDWIVDVWDGDSTNRTSTSGNGQGPQDPPEMFVGAKDPFQVADPGYQHQEIRPAIDPFWFNDFELEEKTQREQSGEENSFQWWSLGTSAAIAFALGFATEDAEDGRKRRQDRRPGIRVHNLL